MATVAKRLEAIDSILESMGERFDGYLESKGVFSHALKKLIREDRGMLRELSIHMRQLRLDIVREERGDDVNG